MTGLTEDDVRALRQQKDLKAFMRDTNRAAQAENTRRRGLVLAHDDLAVKLTEPPASFATPEHWTGYIPPATCCTGAINTSPVRSALVALVAEAERRAAPAQSEAS